MIGRSHFYIGVIALGVWLASPFEAAAYIDPGSSSYLFQLLIGGLTALAFFFGSIRRKVRAGYQWLFRRRPSAGPAPLPQDKATARDV